MHEDVKSTTSTALNLRGDVYYIFSDGVSDQFGGEKSKKFGYKRQKTCC